MIDALRTGKRRDLARALSLLESERNEDRQQALQLLQAISAAQAMSGNTNSEKQRTGQSTTCPNTLRIGITGATGAGKSTLVQALGKRLCKHSPIAVLAVDPTSPLTGGSILGDKIRMQEFASKQNVYVRPLPSSISEGRLADMIKVCEYAGYPLTIVETVGAGQTEYRVRNIVDVLINVISPNSGDTVQCMKKGLYELTDIHVINRHDGTYSQEAKLLADSLASVLSLSASSASSAAVTPPIILVSARNATGIDVLEQAIDQQRCDFTAMRLEQEFALLQSELQRRVLEKLPMLVPQMPKIEQQVRTGKLSATIAAERIIAAL